MIEAVRTVRSEGLSNDGVQSRLQSRRQVRLKACFLVDMMITCFFLRYVCAASANTGGGASSIRVFFFSIGAKIQCHFFNGDSDVLDMWIRLSYLFAISVFDCVRIFRFTYGLNLRLQHVGVDGEPYSAGPIR